MSKRIFISKSSQEVLQLAEYCRDKNYDLISKSLIRFESLPFQISKTYDVVFFSSIRAAEFFLLKQEIDPTCKIACIGNITAEKLNKLGIKVDFIGVKSGKPKEVATSFLKWLGDKKVLIPRSSISKRTIASQIPIDQLIEVPVYTTLPNCEDIPSCTSYIFTSPSNFESFIICNSNINGDIIAWGETTRSCIESHGYQVKFSLENSDLNELLDYLD